MFAPKKTKSPIGPAIYWSGHPTRRSASLRAEPLNSAYPTDVSGNVFNTSVVSWDFSQIPAYASNQDGGLPAPSFNTARRSSPIQAKLPIRQIDDPLEHEADSIADQVMRGPVSHPSPTSVAAEAGLPAQTKPANAQTGKVEIEDGDIGGAASPVLEEPFTAALGRELPATERTFFEPRFGHDFSHVRVHTDDRAARSSAALRAAAYTSGSNIVFAPDRYKPGTTDGRRLIAHELAHVLQQAAGTVSGVQRQVADASAGAAAAGPDALTNEQIHRILSESKDPDDFKLRLGLGPVTDEALAKFLVKKHFTIAGGTPKQRQQQYDGPSIGPSNEPHDRRHRYIRTPVDDPLQYELTEVWATAEEAEEMQKQVDLKEGSDRAYAALAANAAVGGKGGASRAFVANAGPRPGAPVGPPRTESANPIRGNQFFGKSRPEPTVPDTSSPYRADSNKENAAQGYITWTTPQTLPERVALTAARSGQGKVVMEGPFGDPKYQAKGWVKMQYMPYESGDKATGPSGNRMTAEGNKIEIHYMRNTITGETDQFKFVSRGQYDKPKPDPKVSSGDKP